MRRREPVDMLTVSKTLRDAYDRGYREGFEKGVKIGIEIGVHLMKHDLFTERLHRPLTTREQEALAAWISQDPEQVLNGLLSLEGDALASWLVAALPSGLPHALNPPGARGRPRPGGTPPPARRSPRRLPRR